MTVEKIRPQRTFAYGCNYHGDTPCPSVAAFPNERDEDGDLKLLGDPGAYDDLVEGFTGDYQGEVDEKVARQKWLTVLRKLENEEPDDPITEQHRRVAIALGWVRREGANTSDR